MNNVSNFEAPLITTPPLLFHGATLGIITTSTSLATIDPSIPQRAYSELNRIGLHIKEAPNCHKIHGHTAGSIQERVDSLHSFLSNKDIHGIMAFWGGHQTHQLLEYLDWDLFKRYPKPIIGYSDLTSLLNAVTKMTNIVTFSGPAGITFGKPHLFDYTEHYFKRVLLETWDSISYEESTIISTNLWYRDPKQEMRTKANDGWKVFREGTAKGRLWGGNAGTFLLLAGTPYWPDLTNTILFLEDDEAETPATIDRYFTQLRQIGVFDKVNGVIIGRFPDIVNFHENDTFEMILNEAFKGYHFPVMYNLDFGHTDPLMTLPIGLMVEIDTKSKRLLITK